MKDQRFEISAHFLGHRRSVSALFDGYGWRVEADGVPVAAKSLDQAIRAAQMHVGELVGRVGRRPGWGLRVETSSVSASYGDPDPEAVLMPGGAADPHSLVARIRDRWNDGDSAPAALENAVEIAWAYMGRRRQRAA